MIRSDNHREGVPTVVLLHAFPLNGSMWDEVVPLLDARVVVVDLAGLGASPVPAGEPSMAAMVDAVVADLDAAEVVDAVWVGLSTGGYVVAAALGQVPARVAGVVLCSTTTRVIAPDVPTDRLEVADEIETSQTLDAVQGSADEGLGATAKGERPDLRERVLEMVNGNSPAGVAWVARAIAGRPDTSALLAASTVPALLVFGDEDVATPPERAHELQALRPDARLVLLARVGHLTAMEAPAAFAHAVGDLLRSRPGLR